jgi:two-component system sensor histidine kinase/response regulator
MTSTREAGDPRSQTSADSRPLLVVEDNEPNRMLALRLLGRLGYRAIAVRNGREALEALSTGSYPLILMDCHMPEMDGFEATRAIRQREAAGDDRVPVIAMTASVTERDRQVCLEAGMDDFLTKPIMMDVLGDVVARWHPSGRATSSSHHSPSTAPPLGSQPRAAVDPSALEHLREDLGDEDFLRFVDVYLWELPAREAAIIEAAESHSAEGLRLAAHGLKSPSASVGASELAALCSSLEEMGREGTTQGAVAAIGRLRRHIEHVAEILETERTALRASTGA